MIRKGTGHEWRVGGAQNDDNYWETVVVRNVECASVTQIEPVLMCSLERGG